MTISSSPLPRACALVAASVMVITAAAPGYAHHSHASLDTSRSAQHRGVVVRYGWSMPHVFLKVMAPNAKGDPVEYTIELLNPPAMIAAGWGKETFKAGDEIVWEGPPDKNPQRYYSGLTWVEKTDGTRLTQQAGATAQPVPSTDLTGLWVRDLRGGEFHYRPPKGWPFTAKAKALVAAFEESQNPQTDCQDPGPPKATLLPYPLKLSRPDDKTVVIDYELRDFSRTIYLDRNHPAGKPSPVGHSVGWFEGDTLVVETDNFVADRWGIWTGVDSSAQKHLVERFSLSNDGYSLDILMVVTDPEYLAEPVTIDYHMKKLADRDIVRVPCTLENARLYLEAGLD